MNIPTIKADTRKAAGSRAAARLRRDGKLPGIMYGHKENPLPIVLDRHAVELHVEHGAHLFNIDMDGKTQPCLIKDAQYDHLGAALVHVDLARVDLNERVKVHVPIEYRGTPKGIAEGGVLRQELSDLHIECLVANIPDKVRIDVSHLGLNSVLYTKDLKLDPGITAINDPDSVVATCRPPLAEVDATAVAPVEGAAEPEVIAKGKIEVEGEEGAAEKK
ncbi:MAG: 50S ribosomal protein L25 [Planctomycetes bacterium]|nr:50S ribosomal protein L25 [Planctomycetota bacterium]